MHKYTQRYSICRCSGKHAVTFQQTWLTEVWLSSRPCVCRESHWFPDGTALPTLGLPCFSISAPIPWILCPFLHWEFICCGSYLRSLALLTPLPNWPEEPGLIPDLIQRYEQQLQRWQHSQESPQRRRRRGNLCTGLLSKASSIFALQILYIHIMMNCYRELGII